MATTTHSLPTMTATNTNRLPTTTNNNSGGPGSSQQHHGPEAKGGQVRAGRHSRI